MFSHDLIQSGLLLLSQFGTATDVNYSCELIDQLIPPSTDEPVGCALLPIEFEGTRLRFMTLLVLTIVRPWVASATAL
jgi:hypothetical protein